MLAVLVLGVWLAQVSGAAVDNGDTELCLQPKESGPCRAYLPMWYYDADVGTCLEFVYGGCAGNDNQFDSYEECNALCSGVSYPVDDRMNPVPSKTTTTTTTTTTTPPPKARIVTKKKLPPSKAAPTTTTTTTTTKTTTTSARPNLIKVVNAKHPTFYWYVG